MSILSTQERMFHAGLAEGRHDLEMLQLAVEITDSTINADALENWNRIANAYIERARQHMVPRLPVDSVETYARSHSIEASTLEEALFLDSEKGIDPRVHAHRFTHCTLRNGKQVTLWTMHHSFIDMIGIYEVLFDAFPDGKTPLPGKIARQGLKPPTVEEANEYWAGRQDTVRLRDRGRLVQARRRVMFPDAVGHVGANPFLFIATLLAAQLQGERSVTVGHVHNARPFVNADLPAAGPAIVVMPVSTSLESESTVAMTLKRLKEASRDARRFIKTSPPGSTSSLSNVTLNFQPLSWRPRLRAAMEGFGMNVGEVVLRQYSSLPFVLHIENDDGWIIEATSWSGLHNKRELETLVDTCLLNLQQALFHPDKSIQEVAEVPILRGEGSPDLIDDPAKLLRSVFNRYFDKVAVTDQGTEHTFGELGKRVNQYAAQLDHMSVPTGARVGVYSQRGFETYAALLGVILSGRAYVPLDPEYPKARLQYIVEDSALSCVFSNQNDASVFGVPNICLNDVSAEREYAPTVPADTSDVAYIIYTSGSTGKPKGVQISRLSLANLIHAQRTAFGVVANDRVLQFASLCFDASISEIFVTFGAGASLIVAGEGVRAGKHLQNLMADESVTMATLPPSVWATLEPPALPHLATRVSAGEPCTVALVERWSGYGKTVINAYGPTEATVCATTSALDPTDAITIGEPIANVWLKISDRNGRSVWRGETGEIIIGGAGVGLGYVTPPPHNGFFALDLGNGEEPAYRTGDLANLGPNNRLNFLGRRDKQIKRNGVRIELGELEAVLEEHPNVSQAVALMVPKTEELRTYIVASKTLNRSELRGEIAKQLPSVLMPTAITQLENIPTTPSGKIDYQSLLELVPLAEFSQRTRELTEIERLVTSVWCSVLQVEELGPDVNFFDVGGASLQAALIMGELSGIGDFRSPLIAQTIASQAATRSTANRMSTQLRRRKR